MDHMRLKWREMFEKCSTICNVGIQSKVLLKSFLIRQDWTPKFAGQVLPDQTKWGQC